MRITFRLRFALVAAGLFVLAGLALVGVNYALVRASIKPTIEKVTFEPAQLPPDATVFASEDPGVIVPVEGASDLPRRLEEATLRALLSRSAIALVVGALACFALAWLVAGRFLRPVRSVTSTAKELSERTLHRRIRLPGPEDELKELADTFDAMLERLDKAFEAQRRFVANASHELRTPLAISQTAVDVLERKQNPTVEQVRATTEKVRAAVERSERLIDGLLMLARSEAGPVGMERVDVGDVVRDVAHQAGDLTRARQIEVRVRPAQCAVPGDPLLLERLVWNLVENALKYNVDGGWVDVSVEPDGGACRIRVANTGPVVDPAQVPALFEPFRRAGADRVGSAAGAGLGLSIVQTIASTHGGSVHADARPEGGLDVRVVLPCSAAPVGEAPSSPPAGGDGRDDDGGRRRRRGRAQARPSSDPPAETAAALGGEEPGG